MVSFAVLSAASALVAGALSAPTNQQQTFHVKISGGPYDGRYLDTYHTGAGLADVVFLSDSLDNASELYLNGTNLLVETGNTYPMAISAPLGDTNYARWEPTSVSAGFAGSGNFRNVDDKLVGDAGDSGAAFHAWVICEWYHSFEGDNAPQLFTAIMGFDGAEESSPSTPNLPCSCHNADLVIVD